ncbi:MAG: type II toxin-antitoxin system VapC family toxin [Prevotellaceae bacterium]|jgi:predicted nucleic acid-binding protein|nr:type II toxin-antitoxin system VapC family toxin [Prevotellaceae bacterium]
MEPRYLIDTNAALDFMGGKFAARAQEVMAAVMDDEINLSVINKIELLGFSRVEPPIEEFVRCANILPMDDAVVDKAIEVRRSCRMKLPDAIVAATALTARLTLLTHNTKDFEKIKGLRLLDLHALER